MIIPYFDVKSDVRIRVHHFTPNAEKNSPVLVFCHPTGFCSLVYASVVAPLRGFNVFGIDFRSHGYSERGNVENWSGFAADLDAAFTEIKLQTKNEKFIGVGISSGSSAHILNAEKNPSLYAGLYLCEPILFPPGADLTARDQLAKSARKRKNTFVSADEAFINYTTKGGFSSLSPSAIALFCTHGFEPRGDEISLRCKREDEEAIYLSGSANGVFDALHSIQSKTKIVYGEFSNTINKQSAQFIADQMNDASIEEMHSTGHFTLLEDPYQGAKSISAFIADIGLETLSS